MAIYLPIRKDMPLNGLVLRHFSKMKVGDEYYCRVLGKTRQYKHRRVIQAWYYLCDGKPLDKKKNGYTIVNDGEKHGKML